MSRTCEGFDVEMVGVNHEGDQKYRYDLGAAARVDA